MTVERAFVLFASMALRQVPHQRRAAVSVLSWLAVALLVTAPHVGAAAAASPRYAAEPSWVNKVDAPLESEAEPDGTSGGVQYLLFDQQVRVDSTGQSTFRHIAMRAVNESGLASVSRIELTFNPAFQTLIIHQVRVHRGGQVIPKLQPAAVKLLQREQDLEYQVLDGTKSANLILEDVRVGDVIEYAFTLEGTNPVFGRGRFGRFDLQWELPVEKLHHRLIWPAGRPLNIRASNGAVVAAPTASAGFEERVWERGQVPGLALEADAPGWYDPYPAITWGDYARWSDVAQWAVPLYRAPPRLGPELDKLRQSISLQHESSAGRIEAALRLVQSEIRYLGVEVGVNSHAPHPPDVVFKRRFGDCKDKALLLVTLLRSLGVEADPALVSTRNARGVSAVLPSPGAFDHVVVRVLSNGRTYWLDPTRAPQSGLLDRLYQPDYGFALVVSPSTQELTAMGNVQRDAGGRLNKREFSIKVDGSAGPGKPGSMQVKSVHQGLAADIIRSALSTRTKAELQKAYLNFYASYYPGISVAKPLLVEDDSAENRVTVTEHYGIPKLWAEKEGSTEQQLTLFGAELKEFLRGTTQPVRAAPLAVAFPIEVKSTTEVLLPVDWVQGPTRWDTRSDAFEYTASSARGGSSRQVVVINSFRTVSDHVPADRVADHAAKLDQAIGSLSYTMSYLSAGHSGLESGAIHWKAMTLGVLFVAVFGAVAVYLYRYDPPASAAIMEPRLRGISGWLAIAALALLLAPVLSVKALTETWPLFSELNWTALTQKGGSRFSAMWEPVLIFSLGVQLMSLVLGALMLVLFFQKRSSLPHLLSSYFVVSAVVVLADAALLAELGEQSGLEVGKGWAQAVKGAAVYLLWAAYFRRSRRVQATFVHQRALVRKDLTVEAAAPAT